MKRSIIEIDEDRCNGCGECIVACAEGALELIDGKARLVSDVYCDGLGACLGGCPTGALQVIEREADEFSEEAVKEREKSAKAAEPLVCGCPGSMATVLKRTAAAGGCPGAAAMTMNTGTAGAEAAGLGAAGTEASGTSESVSELTHWPIKLELIRPDAPFLRGADMILLADCGGVSIPDLHRRFLRDRVVAIACPKFTDLDQTIGRLAAVIRDGGIGSLTVVHIEVPCCRGLVYAAERAVERAGVDIGLKRIKVGRDGKVQEEEVLHTPESKAASK
jgi:NAD-dependent dihydropyrimidine dehydrogenase PreA subunit